MYTDIRRTFYFSFFKVLSIYISIYIYIYIYTFFHLFIHPEWKTFRTFLTKFIMSLFLMFINVEI